jgi:hypothetical protein
MSIKKIIAIGGAAVLLGVTAVGASLVQAQATPTPSPTQQQHPGERYLAALAARLNVSVDQLRQAMQGARQDVGLPDKPSGVPGGHRGGGPGFGFGGRGPLGAIMGQQLQSLATLFNVTPDQLRQELPGKTLAEVAQAHGKSAQDVINVIVTTSNQQIDQMAQQRNLPADRVAQMKQQVTQRAPEFVSNFRFGTPRTRSSS